MISELSVHRISSRGKHTGKTTIRPIDWILRRE